MVALLAPSMLFVCLGVDTVSSRHSFILTGVLSYFCLPIIFNAMNQFMFSAPEAFIHNPFT